MYIYIYILYIIYYIYIYNVFLFFAVWNYRFMGPNYDIDCLPYVSVLT